MKKKFYQSFEYWNFPDESEKIKTQIKDLENNVILYDIHSISHYYSFYGLKSAFLVSISIPSSFLLSMIFFFF